MDDNTTLKIGLFAIIFIGIIAIGLSMNHNKVNVRNAEESYLASLQKIDSLNNVIDSLQTEIFVIEDGCDYREHRYEAALVEYELSVSYLKQFHPRAYKDVNRIIGMKQRYQKLD
jgi:hypothetical protein